MQEKDNFNRIHPKRDNKLLKIMKTYVLITFLCVFSAMAENLFPQSESLTLKLTNVTVKDAIRQIEQSSDYLFLIMDESEKEMTKTVSIDLEDKTIDEILTHLFKNTQLSYSIVKRQITIRKNPSVVSLAPQNLSEVEIELQTRKIIRGTITNVQGEAIIGANIIEKGTTNGTVTDIDGNFSLSVDQNSIIVISYIGYMSLEVNTAGQNRFSIVLQEDAEILDELVVVGYGTMKKSDLTGSVSEINVDKLIDQPTVSIDQMLVGRVPGMQIQQGSGAPGAAPIITIRGSGSLGAGNQPLYVIDGMPYSNIDNENLNPLTFINPHDIESMTVLKDASSTSIYGSRGSNGVIIITTKNAGKDITEINFSSSIGTSQVPIIGRPQMMSAYDFATYQRERIALGIKNKLKRDAVESDYPEEYQNVESLGEGTNWYDLILRKAIIQNYYLDIQKSQGNSRFFLGLGYSNQEGVIYSSGLERLSVNMNYKFNLEDKILIDASLRPTYVIQDRIISGESRADYLSMALWGNPVMKAYDEEGKLIPYIQPPVTSYSANPWGFPNPVFALQNTDEKYSVLRNLGNISLQLNILPELSFKTILNTVYNNAELNSFKPSTIGGPNSPPKEGSATASRSRSSAFNWLWENTLNFKKDFEKHSLTILAGYTAQKQRSRGLSLNAGPFANDLIRTINAAPDITSWTESINEWSMISYLGRADYSYDNKYLMTFTMRIDGSSRFGANSRFANFPSAALAWRISEEDFFKELTNLDQLKLRSSYGKGGNNNIGNYTHLSTINPTEYVFNNNIASASTISLSNPYLGWEESSQLDFGIDVNMFKNRLIFTGDLYRKETSNMLLNDYIPTITGFSTQYTNKGSVENKGIELALVLVPFKDEFVWNLGFNIAFNRNKILSTNSNNDPILSGNVDRRASNISEVGQPIGMFYGFVLEGVYSEEDIKNPEVAKYSNAVAGWPKYKDLNNDGKIQEILDYTALGSPHPDFTYGMNTSMQYRNFDLTLSLNGRKGGYIVNGLRQTIDNMQGIFNVQKEWVNRWRSPQEPGDGIHANGPQLVHRLNSLWLEDASYIRITNLTLGYTLPQSFLQKNKVIKHVRFYASAQNLLTITNYKGANPEGQASNVNSTLSPGIDNNAYPLPRNITVGINVKF